MVTHSFVNPQSDGADTTVVRPSDWNDDHVVDFGEVGDISTQAFGDAAAAGATGEIADAGHVHGMPANPITRAAGTSVAAGAYWTWLVLSGNSGDITGTGLTTVMTMTGVGAGRYHFFCQLIYQTTATSTGIGLAVNHTGTLTQFIAEKRTSTTATTTATNAPTMASTTAAGNMYEGQAIRTKDTLIGAVSVSVDAADTDMLISVEGFMVVSGSGDLEIKLRAESAGLVCRAMQGSFLELKKLS